MATSPPATDDRPAAPRDPRAERPIVSLLSAATEMLYAIGLGERVAGVSHECDFPPAAAAKPRVTYALVDSAAESGAIDREVREKIARGEALYAIDEALLKQCFTNAQGLQPGLIVTQAQCDVCAVRHEDVLALLERIDPRRTIDVVSLNPAALADILADILRVGEAAGAAEAARRCAFALEERVDAVRRKTAAIPAAERPRLAVVEWIDPIMIAGNWTPELAALAGAEYALATAGAKSAYADFDAIRRYDPQVLVVAACGFDLARTRREAARLTSLSGWSELSAVREARAWAVDGNAYFNRPGPRIVDTLELLAHLVHPERFSPPPGFIEAIAERL